MKVLPLAAMSVEAQAFLEQGAFVDKPSMYETSILEIRKQTLELYTPTSQQAITNHGVTCSETEVAGVRCLEVTPSKAIKGRQILYAFGGGFVQGSPFEDLPISAAISAKCQAKVICPYHRLAPENPFPAGLDDITSVAELLLADNPSTLFAGESAGGNLVLALTHRLGSTGNILPNAIAALSPVVDLEYIGDSHLADRDPFLKASRKDEVRVAYLNGADPRHPEASPIYGDFGNGFPPAFITTGTRDLLLSGCLRLEKVMREAGVPIELRVWDGMWHVFEFYPGIPEAEASLSEIAEFLNRHF
ncbi:MAG: alpha/beta hydrolase [Pseudomonadota bacterium]